MSDADDSPMAAVTRNGSGDDDVVLDVLEETLEVRLGNIGNHSSSSDWPSTKASSNPGGKARSAGSDDARELCGAGSSAAERREMRRESIFHHTLDRQLHGSGARRRHELPPPRRSANNRLCHELPQLLQANEYCLGTVNKVFNSRWLNERSVVMGTKCNKMLVLDLIDRSVTHIPSIPSSFGSKAADCPCGIHAVAINPSKSLVATGGEHTNDLAVYKLPTFDPVFLGEEGHKDWIFDISWIDDEVCVSGSRDNKLTTWRISPDDDLCCSDIYQSASQRINSAPVHIVDSSTAADVMIEADLPRYTYGKPIDVKPCASADKIRALAYNQQDMELGVLSLNGKIHLWDVNNHQQKSSRKLPYTRENVCISYDQQRRVYAVGSQTHVSLIDPRSLRHTMSIESRQKNTGVRSVGFNSNIITIGTGGGWILFYDLMAGRYLDRILDMGRGYLRREDIWHEYFNGYDFPNAAYTHSFDDTGTRLFTAGGPLPSGLYGNYAAIWQ